MAQLKVISVLSIEHQQYGVPLHCTKKKEVSGILYIMMSLFV